MSSYQLTMYNETYSNHLSEDHIQDPAIKIFS